MKDNDGNDIRCRHSEWRICDNQDNKDYICDRPYMTGYHRCYCDEYCRYYEPITQDQSTGGAT